MLVLCRNHSEGLTCATPLILTTSLWRRHPLSFQIYKGRNTGTERRSYLHKTLGHYLNPLPGHESDPWYMFTELRNKCHRVLETEHAPQDTRDETRASAGRLPLPAACAAPDKSSGLREVDTHGSPSPSQARTLTLGVGKVKDKVRPGVSDPQGHALLSTVRNHHSHRDTVEGRARRPSSCARACASVFQRTLKCAVV